MKLAKICAAATLCIGIAPTIAHAQLPTSAEVAAERQEQLLVGSWLFTYDVPGFGAPIPALLSFTQEGIVIESDFPGPTPFGGAVGIAIASNGQGEWKRVNRTRSTFTYKKLLYNQDGTQYGTATTTGLVTLNAFRTSLSVDLSIQFTDKAGQVTFSGKGRATATRIED